MSQDTSDVSIIIDREKESQRWMRENFYDELTETFRAIKCRTKPIYKRDGNGNETTEVDKSKTNVAMPEVNVSWRKNVARYTAQPYRLNYIGGNPLVAQALSALAAQQYDRSNEAFHDRRIVMMAEAIGFSYGKLYWDKLTRVFKMRKLLIKNGIPVFTDRASIMRAQGAPEDEIKGAVSQFGDQMSEDEISEFAAKTGKEVTIPTDITKYEGPCVKAVFPGDLSMEPGVLTLADSDWVIERYRESALWLKSQLDLTYDDPETGQEVPAFDPKAVKALLDLDPEPQKAQERENDLRWMWESTMGRNEIRMDKRLRGRKKFDILEQHEIDEDGLIWITWISDKYRDRPLGRMPYPWDLYGKFTYSELVPLPDMISAMGDSTPRLMRFLHQMHNRTVAQNFDYVRNVLKRTVLVPDGVEFSSDVMDRGDWRELRYSGGKLPTVLDEPGLPPGAFEREAQVLRMAALLEPVLNTTDVGTQSNPMAGKLATTAIINAKAADALTQFKLDGRNLYLRELGQKKLWMNQQAAEEQWEINEQFWGEDLKKKLGEVPEDQAADARELAISYRNGKAVAIKLDPYEIQEDYQVEPEAGSYLAVDDEIRQDAAMKMTNVLAQFPGIIDARKVARFAISTVRGVGNPDDYILPEQPPAPQPPKVGVNISVPLDKMPADVINQVLPMAGLQPSEELEHRDTVEGVKQLGEAARAADEMTQPAGVPDEVQKGTPKQAEKVSA